MGKWMLDQTVAAGAAGYRSTALSSELDAGSREESASKHDLELGSDSNQSQS